MILPLLLILDVQLKHGMERFQFYFIYLFCSDFISISKSTHEALGNLHYRAPEIHDQLFKLVDEFDYSYQPSWELGISFYFLFLIIFFRMYLLSNYVS